MASECGSTAVASFSLAMFGMRVNTKQPSGLLACTQVAVPQRRIKIDAVAHIELHWFVALAMKPDAAGHDKGKLLAAVRVPVLTASLSVHLDQAREIMLAGEIGRQETVQVIVHIDHWSATRTLHHTPAALAHAWHGVGEQLAYRHLEPGRKLGQPAVRQRRLAVLHFPQHRYRNPGTSRRLGDAPPPPLPQRLHARGEQRLFINHGVSHPLAWRLDELLRSARP